MNGAREGAGLKLTTVSKTYGTDSPQRISATSEVSLEIEAGALVALTGFASRTR